MAKLWKEAGVRDEIIRSAGLGDFGNFVLARIFQPVVLPTSRWRGLTLYPRAGLFSRLPLKHNPGDLSLLQCEMSSEFACAGVRPGGRGFERRGRGRVRGVRWCWPTAVLRTPTW